MGIDQEVDMNGHSSQFICGVVEGFYGRPWTNEQRKNLFERMNVMGLNTYLYGPKDDLKHRFEWRALYNDEEIDLLRSLVQSAKVNNVNFVYSISPGIDIVYSQQNEVKAIIRKLKQVEEIGCTSFALLFDDIEITMNEQDAKTFPSFVAAQIAVTNEVHSFMNADMFYFCPTEYCSTRAIPDVTHSDYLNTLGKNLAQGIEIMWTGAQVVSPELSPEHAQHVEEVLRRKPLIWDNYHANDYDPKRVFLGPLKGRPVALKNHISGLLLNPNCKFEANFVPFITLSIWNRCEKEEESRSDEEMTTVFTNGPSPTTYNPSLALDEALDKWLELYFQGSGPSIPPISQVECTMAPLTPVIPEALALVPPLTIRTCEGNDLLPSLISGSAPPLYTSANSATTVTVQAYQNPAEHNFPTFTEETPEITDDALLTANSLSTNYGEAMTDSNQNSQTDICSTVAEKGSESAEISMEDDVLDSDNRITHGQLSLLVDIYYLPFDYGDQALTMLEDFQFMHKNAHILRQHREMDSDTIAEWDCRFENFQSKVSRFELFFRLFLESPNRSLVQELFPYVAEAHATLTTLGAILSWMQKGNLMVLRSHNVESWWKNRLMNVEPWTFGNGLLPDLQKLVISSPELANLFLYKTPVPLIVSSYRIEPLNVDDLDPQLCYDTFAYPKEKEFFEEISSCSSIDLFFDRCFGLHFKSGRPEHNFQINEIDSHGNSSLFAVITSVFSLNTTMPFVKSEFIDEYRDKFVEMLSSNKKGEEMFLKNLEEWPIFQLPKAFLVKYPSFIEVRWRNRVTEAAWVRRLFQCTASALAMNGSNGLFTIVPVDQEEQINLFYKFGLSAINDVQIDGYLVMGHLLQTSG